MTGDCGHGWLYHNGPSSPCSACEREARAEALAMAARRVAVAAAGALAALPEGQLALPVHRQTELRAAIDAWRKLQ